MNTFITVVPARTTLATFATVTGAQRVCRISEASREIGADLRDDPTLEKVINNSIVRWNSSHR